MKRWLIRCLLRCYPRPWRRRYGEEFAALLEAAPGDAFQFVDALRSALDARWRQRGEGLMSAVANVRLGEAERSFWRRWVLACAIAGSVVGLISTLVLPMLFLAGKGSSSTGYMLHSESLYALPLLGLVALAIGVAQWQALRALLPTVSRWWIAATMLGPIAALLVVAPPRDYRMLPDLWTMSASFLTYLGEVIGTSDQRGDAYDWIRVFGWPTIYFGGIIAALQAYVLKGTLRHAGWWIGTAVMASIAGLATARLLSQLQYAADYRLMPEPLQLERVLLDVAITACQLGAACAIYGVVSGFGLITLCRAHQPARVAAAAIG